MEQCLDKRNRIEFFRAISFISINSIDLTGRARISREPFITEKSPRVPASNIIVSLETGKFSRPLRETLIT